MHSDDSVSEGALMQKLTILGATGATGQHVVRQALERGHQVTALVRDPTRLPIQHERLRVTIGTIEDNSAPLQQSLKGQDVVISALGRGRSLKSDHLIQHAVPPLLAAMTAAGVGRLVFTSGIGVGDAYAEAPLFSRIVIKVLLRDIYADKAIGEDLVRMCGLEWTIVQAAQLTNGPLTRRYRAGEDLKQHGMPTVSRADLAHFLLNQVDDRTYVRKTVRLGY
jgi:putative NADH-flavin reductase